MLSKVKTPDCTENISAVDKLAVGDTYSDLVMLIGSKTEYCRVISDNMFKVTVNCKKSYS